MTVSIIIADKFPVHRRGMRAWLEDNDDFRLLGEAQDKDETLHLVQRHQPQVVVLDPHHFGVDGAEVLSKIRQESPHTRVVLFSHISRECYLLKGLRHGAVAFVRKDSPQDVLVEAVRAAARGDYFLGPPFENQLVETYLKKAQTSPPDILESLTPREREVLDLVVEGLSSSEIGQQLHISPRTVEMHRIRMMHKLNLRNQTDLIRFALRRGLISLE